MQGGPNFLESAIFSSCLLMYKLMAFAKLCLIFSSVYTGSFLSNYRIIRIYKACSKFKGKT